MKEKKAKQVKRNETEQKIKQFKVKKIKPTKPKKSPEIWLDALFSCFINIDVRGKRCNLMQTNFFLICTADT